MSINSNRGGSIERKTTENSAKWIVNFDFASNYPQTFANNKTHLLKILRKKKLQKILEKIKK